MKNKQGVRVTFEQFDKDGFCIEKHESFNKYNEVEGSFYDAIESSLCRIGESIICDNSDRKFIADLLRSAAAQLENNS